MNNIIDDDVDFGVPAFSTHKKEENVFKLAKASGNEIRMTNFLLSCVKAFLVSFEYIDPSFISEIEKNKNFSMRYKSFLSRTDRL